MHGYSFKIIIHRCNQIPDIHQVFCNNFMQAVAESLLPLQQNIAFRFSIEIIHE